MSDDRTSETQARAESLMIQAREIRERVSQLQRETYPRGIAAARKAADEALAAAAVALQHSGEAHFRAAKAHREFADLLEKTGNLEQAAWHRAAAVADEEAATFDLRQTQDGATPAAE